MPYKLGEIWNEASTYITTDKKVGIGTNTNYPKSTLDVYGDISENGLKLSEKYTLKTDDNKKNSLVVFDSRNNFNDHSPIIWYKFNKDYFTTNTGTAKDVILNIRGTPQSHQSNYIIGTGSAKINSDLYYEISLTTDSTTRLTSSLYTICFWIYFSDVSNKTIINSIKDSNHNFKIVLDNRKIKFITYTQEENEQEENLTSSQEFKANQWYHITFSIDMSGADIELDELIIYIDGIKNKNKFFNEKNIIINTLNKPSTIYLGDSNLSESFDGYIDDFRIYEGSIIPLSTIQQDIIGNLLRITPNNISSLGNYGIDIENFNNLVKIGNNENSVDLTIYGYLSVSNIRDSIIVEKDLTVNNDIIEKQQRLIDKYALISSIDKNTDIIISKMINKDDVDTLYKKMPNCFTNKLILGYNFDYEKEDLNNSNVFFNNISENENFNRYNIIPNKIKSAIKYYGAKYVKGTSSLEFNSNIDGVDYYYFETNKNKVDNNSSSTFSRNECYTIAFWIRFNEINRKQIIFNFGYNENENNIKLFLENKKLFFYIENEEICQIDNEFKKDQWYHITLILKNNDYIQIPTSEFSEEENNSNLLIENFEKLNYERVIDADTTKFNFKPIQQYDDTIDTTQDYKLGIYIYINGIETFKINYSTTSPIPEYFGNEANLTNFFGVLNPTDTNNYLNGYIDDFKMYETIVPIQYINKYIIGTTLVIQPGKLSAIGNYGIDIINFDNLVSVGNINNKVNLDVNGVLTLKNYNSSGLISVIDNNYLQILNLNTHKIITSNIEISKNIQGRGFELGSNNKIDELSIDFLQINSNIKCSEISTDTVNIDNNLIVGNNSSNRFELGSLTSDTITRLKTYAEGTIPSIKVFNTNYPSEAISTSSLNKYDINIFDKSIICYGLTNNDNNFDIHFKNSFVRDETCNLESELTDSFNIYRNKTRLKVDVGNIKIDNGYIELEKKDILKDKINSKLKIEEDKISINDNNNFMILTNNSLTFSNGLDITGFINNDYLKINKIEINESLNIPSVNTINSDFNIYSIDTSNANLSLGKIRGYLGDNSKIVITDLIKTTSNIETNYLYSSNVTIEKTLTVDSLTVLNAINFGLGNTNTNTINGGNGSLDIDNIITSNLDVKNEINTYKISFIDDSQTVIDTNAKIKCKISSNCVFETLTSFNCIDLSVENIINDINTKTIFINNENDNTIISSSNIQFNNNINKINIDLNGVKYINSLNGIPKDIIKIENGIVTLNCDFLQVEEFKFEEDIPTTFTNIISFNKGPESPYIYIGNNTTNFRDIINTDLDVLYIDTGEYSFNNDEQMQKRLRTGNLLVNFNLDIGENENDKIKIHTKDQKIYFTDSDFENIMVFSLKQKSVGINISPDTTDDNIKFFVDGGLQTTGDIIAFKNISDIRFKNNIISLNQIDSVNIINQLNPVKFIWNNNLFNSNMANKKDIGFIAQEVDKIIPEAVSKCRIEMNEIDYHYINYERIIPYLVNNIKYLNNKIVELENKLNGTFR